MLLHTFDLLLAYNLYIQLSVCLKIDLTFLKV